jgi:hypothetical protein
MEPDPNRLGKTIKRPTDVRTGHHCNSNLPEHQYSYSEAAATGRPVGFVFAKEDGLFFLDIDNCLEASGWSALATDLCRRFVGAAVEVSQSGKGLHILGQATVPAHSCRNIPLGLELYTDSRFCALTQLMAYGDAASDHTTELAALVAEYFPPNEHGDVAGWRDEPLPEYGGPEDDVALIRMMLAQKPGPDAAFGNSVTPAHIWNLDEDKLRARFPDGNGGYDRSQVDGSLASSLAFYTGHNHERTRDIMLASPLARAKWIERPEWLETTILRASSVVKNYLRAKEPMRPPGTSGGAFVPSSTIAAIVARPAGREFLTPPEQIPYFAGCIYVTELHKIWTPASGELVDKPRFDVLFGGHIFVLDPSNEKMTDSAFDVFTKSRVFVPPSVQSTCFRPEHPSGAIIVDEGTTLVNTYFPIETTRRQGDPSRFLAHLKKLLPNGRDAEIMLCYMARCIQSPGVKLPWWPVLQGAEGNGKSLVESVMSFCIGLRYSHLVNPDAMAKTGNQFNKWILRTLWVAFEEIYVAHRREFLESFKATVTNKKIPVEGKGVDQATADNRANGLMLTNHREAVPVSVDSRRYCIFYTAQQCAADLIRDGMDGDYFPSLYNWLNGEGEYALLGTAYGLSVVNDYLHSYEIAAEFDPAGLCHRAPVTSSTVEARSYGLGRAEQEILEAVDEGRSGFAGGWASSFAVDRLLDSIKAAVPRSKRRELMHTLGYDLHPALPDGRATMITAPDNGKPRLYVKRGHLAAQLTDPATILKAYATAQESATSAAAAARFG